MCGVISPKDLVKVAKKRDLDGLAVCDHNTTAGIKEVKRENKKFGLDIIPGEEVTTEFGHVLVYYVQEEIPKCNFFELLDVASAQDAIVVIAHPFRFPPNLNFGYSLRKLVKKIDGVEVINGRNFWFANIKARRTAEELGFPMTGGSDGHTRMEIGRVFTVFEGDLRKALQKRETTPVSNMPLGIIPGQIISGIFKGLRKLTKPFRKKTQLWWV